MFLHLRNIFRKSGSSNYFMQKMSLSEVVFEEHGNKGVVILNRPTALNALNLSMIRLIYMKLKEWESCKSLVIIKGSGEKAFCAGGDVRSITDAGKIGDPLTKTFFKEEYMLNSLISRLKIPYVAFINGITMGGGVGLSVHGKYRIGSENSLFAMPETGIGLFPDVGGSYFLPKLRGNLGLFLGLTGHRLKAHDVLHSGIATHFCTQDKIKNLEESLLENDEPTRNILDRFATSSTLTNAKFSLSPYLDQIDACFCGDSVEEILTKLESDGSDWAKKQISVLNKMSPTSLKITYEVIKRGNKSLSLQQCLTTEYRLTQRVCQDHDFYEGVRALLVDRDNNPNWKPNSLSQVTESTIQKYFSPLEPEDELSF